MRTLRLFVACSLLLATTAPRAAWAQSGDADDGDDEVGVQPAAAAPAAAVPAPSASESEASSLIDTVYLRNGGMIRGRIQEILPGSHVAITLVTGETRRVPWSEIGKVVVASSAAVAAQGGAVVPTVASPTPPVPMQGPLVRVHVASKKPVALLRRPPGSTAWVHACMSPCDKDLPLGDTYKVSGSGITASSEFRLQEQAGHTANVVVDPASTSGVVIGGVIGGAGAVGAYVGLILTLVGVAFINNDCESRNIDRYGPTQAGYQQCVDDRANGPKLRNAGLVTMGVGAVATVAGAFILFRSLKTDVSQSSGGGSDDAYVREPVWRAPAPPSVAASSPSLYVPLLQGSF